MSRDAISARDRSHIYQLSIVYLKRRDLENKSRKKFPEYLNSWLAFVVLIYITIRFGYANSVVCVSNE